MKRSLAPTLLLLALAAIPAWPLSPEAALEADTKLTRIAEDELGPGETVTLTEDELNSFLHYTYAEELPDGVRDLAVRIEDGIGVVSGFADFAKLSEEGESPGRFLLMLLRGERKFEARVRYMAARGVARVEIDSFLVDGRDMSGVLLDWAVNTFVAPRMEGFELGRPTPLGHNLEEIRLEPKLAVIVATDTFADR
jgi:hypothetical protein